MFILKKKIIRNKKYVRIFFFFYFIHISLNRNQGPNKKKNKNLKTIEFYIYLIYHKVLFLKIHFRHSNGMLSPQSNSRISHQKGEIIYCYEKLSIFSGTVRNFYKINFEV